MRMLLSPSALATRVVGSRPHGERRNGRRAPIGESASQNPASPSASPHSRISWVSLPTVIPPTRAPPPFRAAHIG